MKYVSPTTERRRQQQKRKKLITFFAVCLVIVLGVIFFFFLNKWNKEKQNPDVVAPPALGQLPSEDSTEPPIADSAEQLPQEDDSKEPPTVEDKPENPPNEDTQGSSSKPDTEETVQKPKKQSLFQKIGAMFTKKDKGKQEIVFPVTAFGRTIEEPAISIASLSPTATEALLSLPIQSQVIAVSEYCNQRNLGLVTIGTPLIPQVDKILQIAPQYLIVQAPLNGTDKIKIEQSGIKVLEISMPKTTADLKEIYRSMLALVYGKNIAITASDNIIFDIENRIEMYKTALTNVTKQSTILLFNKYGMVATKDTLEASILQSFFSIANDGSGYYSGTMEQLVQTNPQILIVPDSMTAEDIKSLGFDTTDAYNHNKIYYVPIKDFENISPKMVNHIIEIANDVYGENIKPIDFTQDKAESKKK